MPSRPCPECGFDPATVSPQDAAVALRSFPRRFAALARADEETDDETGRPGEAVRPDPAEVEAAARAAAAEIAALAEQLRLVLIEDQPSLPPRPGAAAAPSPSVTSASDAFAALSEAARKAAELAEQAPGRAWSRTAARDGKTVSASELLAEAVHAGAHRLHQLEDRRA